MLRIASVVTSLVCLLLVGAALGQNSKSSDVHAIDLANRSVLAMTGGVNVTDATLETSVTSITGATREVIAGTFVVKGQNESRLDLALSNGARTEIRNDIGAFPQGASTDSKGQISPSALHNCWVNPSWFFPVLSYLSQTSDPTLVFSYVGQEARNGLSVEHLRISRYLARQSPQSISWIQKLSSMDVYLVSTSLLPVAFTFNAHPDENAASDTATDIEFANYQVVSGVRVPLHIQKLVAEKLVLDIVVNQAVLNSGVSDTLFVVQ